MKSLSELNTAVLVCGAIVVALSASLGAQSGLVVDDLSVSTQRQTGVLPAARIERPATLNASIAREISRIVTSGVFRRVSAEAQNNQQQQPTQGWIRRHPKLFGALVGFGVGCPIGAAQVGGSQDDFFNALDEWACPVLGGIGAAVGAGLGAALSR